MYWNNFRRKLVWKFQSVTQRSRVLHSQLLPWQFSNHEQSVSCPENALTIQRPCSQVLGYCSLCNHWWSLDSWFLWYINWMYMNSSRYQLLECLKKLNCGINYLCAWTCRGRLMSNWNLSHRTCTQKSIEIAHITFSNSNKHILSTQIIHPHHCTKSLKPLLRWGITRDLILQILN